MSPRGGNAGMKKPGARRSAKILLIACGVLLGLVAAEIALRVADYSFPVFYTTTRNAATGSGRARAAATAKKESRRSSSTLKGCATASTRGPSPRAC
jgi:hypothetical protein